MWDTMNSSWAGLLALGAFHGINPGMGWLFAVALGMQERRRSAVCRAILPLALGHGLAIAAAIAMLARGATDGALWPHLAAIAWQALWVAVCVRTGATLFRRRVMKSGGGGRPRRRGLLRRLLRNTRA